MNKYARKGLLTASVMMLLPVLFDSCSSMNVTTPGILPDHPNIQYRGRIEFSNPQVPRFSMPSSSIKIKFKGTTLKGVFSGKNFGGNGLSYLYIVVDGKASPYEREILEIQMGKREYVIAEGLEDAEHVVELTKLNEYWGMVEFHGLTTNGSGPLPLPPKEERFIEFYGDSNPAGWSAWDDRDKGGDAEAGGYYTYPGYTGRALGAQIVNFSAGGHGITPKMVQKDLTRYFGKIHINTDNESTNVWDFESNYIGRKPDVVVINLGANDYYADITKQMLFEGWQKLVLKQIRPVYPDAHVILANSKGWAFGEPTDYLEEAMALFGKAGETNISFVKFPWLWGQEHAVASEQAGFAGVLTEHIASVMGWEINAETADYRLYSSFPKKGNDNLLGNASFESSILVRPDGWRPGSPASKAKTLIANAKDGKNVVEAHGWGGVHQAVAAAEGKSYEISVWAKGAARIRYEFRNQAQRVVAERTEEFPASDTWSQYSIITEKAPKDTWQIKVNLDAAKGQTVLFDAVQMRETD